MLPHQKFILILAALRRLAAKFNGHISSDFGKVSLSVMLATGPASMVYEGDTLKVHGDKEDGPLASAAQSLLDRGRVGEAWLS